MNPLSRNCRQPHSERSVCNMPKTALMGSPLAVIGTVFRHRRTLAKTGAAVGGVLMLPILFLVMLPGLVFGDLSENTGALTSNTVISENIRASNQAIVEVLQESMMHCLLRSMRKLPDSRKEILPLSAILTLPVSS